MTERPTIQHRAIFSIITCFSLYFLIDFIFTYLFQDSSPKQTVALLRIVILVIVNLVIYFFFFKITKNKFEDLGKIFFNVKTTGHLTVSIFFVLALLFICIVQYQAYKTIEAIGLYNATESLKKTLDGLPYIPAAQKLKSLL